MTLVVANTGKDAFLADIFAQNYTIRLFSNNVTPTAASTTGSFTEVVGGGYSEQSLANSNWTISGQVALYNSFVEWDFTGVTNAPGTIYGYYIVDGSNVLMWAERFPSSVLPYSPVSSSIIRIKPRLQVN